MRRLSLIYQWRFYTLLLILSIVYNCEGETNGKLEKQYFEVPVLEYNLNGYSELDSIFDYHGYSMTSIRNLKSVPPVFVDQITPSIRKLKSTIKKRNFVRILLSHTLQQNQEINTTRIQLFNTLNKDTLSVQDSTWLDSLSKVYRVRNREYVKLIDKIDVIPPSLIIVQGIIESGWATSKYAIKGNNLFGMYGSRRVQLKSGGSRPKAKEFDSIEECIQEYITNLNRHGSYRTMRQVRAEMRELGITITGKKLAKTLMNYSTLGERYVRKIVSMINLYDLEEYDQYVLRKGIIVKIQIEK